LLYTGPVVLNGILPPAFDHFLLLVVGITILASPRLASQYYDYAGELLVLIVRQAESLYGKEILVYNVHGLTHLAQDVKLLGCLDEFSAFPFENKLGQLKKMVKKQQFVISQIIRRLTESENIHRELQVGDRDDIVTKMEHCLGPLPIGFQDCRQNKQIKLAKFFVSVASSDKCIITSTGVPCLVQNILRRNDFIFLVCKSFLDISNVFEHPLPFTNIGIRKVTNELSQDFVISISEAAQKCACLAVNEELSKLIVFPLMHC